MNDTPFMLIEYVHPDHQGGSQAAGTVLGHYSEIEPALERAKELALKLPPHQVSWIDYRILMTIAVTG